MKNEPRGRSRLVPFLVGGLIGAAAGLLLAPKAGTEVRKQIKDFATSTRDRVATTVAWGIDMYDTAKIAFASAVDAGRDAYLQERQKFQTPV